MSLADINLLSAPLELNGDWGDSPPETAAVAISRMREACLSELQLLSDRQPNRLRVDNHRSGPPHIWLHSDNPTMAWIVVDIQPRAWSQLTYQFGHELGHVLCNSWMWKVDTPPPSRWLEECLVEAFSMRGIARLADRQESEPPFNGDAQYGRSLHAYRAYLEEKYQSALEPELAPAAGNELAAWWRANRSALESAGGLTPYAAAAILAVLKELEADKSCVEDLAALNRWPGRSTVPLEDYLRLWGSSCREIGASGRLPARLQEMFELPTAAEHYESGLR
jgi:hypothetical protein